MKGLVTYSLLLFSLVAFSQQKGDKENKDNKKDVYLSKGNSQFADKEYVDAEANYRISQSDSPTKSAGAYNLGNAIYRQGKVEESMYAYLTAIEKAESKKDKHRAYHNLGNALMKVKDYQTAVEAYRNALRNDPYDEETRYNFALAKEMLKKNPPPPQQNQDQNKDQQDKQDNKDNQNQGNNNKNDQKGNNQGDKDNKDNKQNKPDDKKGNGQDKEKGDEQKDKGGQQDKDKSDKDGQNKPGGGDEGDRDQEPSEGSPSKQRMENLLDAMNNEEKKVQDKVNAKKAKGMPPQRQEKDW